MSRSPRSSLPLLALPVLLAVAACKYEVMGPAASPDGLPAGLDVALTVEPDDVVQHAAFAVRLRVANVTADTIRVVTAHGCLALPHAMRDGRRYPFRGSALGCTAAITTHTFPPGRERTLTWEMRAELYAEHPGDEDGAPAPRGTYRVQVVFDAVGKPAGEKPAVSRTLRVR